MGKMHKQLTTYREHRPTDILKKPELTGKRPPASVLAHLPEDWTTAITEAEEWPYLDPDDNGLADPEPTFANFPATKKDLPADIEPFSQEEPWGIMFTESSRTYQLFDHYRSLGITRTHRAVADFFDLSRQYVDQVATKFNWETRVRAWDDYRERVYTTELLLGVKEMAHKHAEVAAQGVAALATAFSGIVESMADPDSREAFLAEIAELPVRTQLALAQGSARVIPGLMNAERLSRGLPTEISAELRVSEARVTIQTTDDLADILLGIAGPLAVSRSGDSEGEIVDVDG